MAPNNGLVSAKAKDSSSSDGKRGRTTILQAGTVEDRGNGTTVDGEIVSEQIRAFLRGEGRFGPKAEVRGFFTVWTFVTRLPGPTWVDHHPGYLMRGMAYFPLSGLFIGSFVSVFYDLWAVVVLFRSAWNYRLASLVAEVASLWITGCFHEDGLADSADGIGGGWTSEQILKIMTDTRLGTYGCAILVLYMVGKVELIATLGASVWCVGACRGGGPAIVVTHVLARLTAPLLIKTRHYVDEQGPKYRFYSFFMEAKHLVTWSRVAFASISAWIVGCLCYGLERGSILVGAVFVMSFWSGRYAEFLMGGVMGDYLGATICVTEVCLLTLISLFPPLEKGEEPFFGWSLVKDLVTECLVPLCRGDVAFHTLVRNVVNDDGKLALVKFIGVVGFTAVWCSNVGHPPVFVRKTVAVTAKTGVDTSTCNNEGQKISLEVTNDDPTDSSRRQTTNNDDERPSALEARLADPNQSFLERYEAVRSYIDTLAKPVGSLGTLEDWGARVAALQRTTQPKADKVVCLIFAADHGVAKDKADGGMNCSAYPQAVTRKVVEALHHGVAGASVLSRQHNVCLRVIDVGLADRASSSCSAGGSEKETEEKEEWSGSTVVSCSSEKVRGGTRNFCAAPALSDKEFEGCLRAGRQEVQKCRRMDTELFVFGEVGIGNTTTSSALLTAVTGQSVPCGCGASTTRDGNGNSTIAQKTRIVEEALQFHGGTYSSMMGNPREAMKRVGGAEIVAIVGGMLEAASLQIPILVDGYIVTTAALMACLINPEITQCFLYATRSNLEPGQEVALREIQKRANAHHGVGTGTGTGTNTAVPPNHNHNNRPALDMGLRMGEATGALAAVPLVRSACAVVSELATLDRVLNLNTRQEEQPQQ